MSVRRALALSWMVVAPTVVAADLKCMLGMTRCIKSQGTEIPSSKAIEILDRCDEFTNGDLGRTALKLSYQQMNERAAGRLTPLFMAWSAFADLYDSPLAFERKSNAADTNYVEVKRSCQQLARDFNDDSKWTK